jgi:hypothetical protein
MKAIPAFLCLSAIAASAAPPTGAHLAWLQQHFPTTYGNAALEATVWGDQADPDGDGCGNLVEFVTQRDPNVADAHLGPSCRIDGEDLVATYRETTATNPGVTWRGEWSVDLGFWVMAGARYQTVSTHSGYRIVEARIRRNRETLMQFRVTAQR